MLRSSRGALVREQNIDRFNDDVDARGGYVYTDGQRFSSVLATRIQSEGIVRALREHFPGSPRILDAGCGDGTYTLELARTLQPRRIVGFDPAQRAVAAATAAIPDALKDTLSFEVGDVYDVDTRYRPGEFDIVVVRGMLHHLYDVRRAIAAMARVFEAVLVLEPSGYNPILKGIEKLSSYHRLHEEKSYWPPALNRWFKEAGFSVQMQRYFCIVPYFCPTSVAKALWRVQPFFEAIPLLHKVYCGTNLVLYRRNGQG